MYPILKEGVSMWTSQPEGSDAIHYYIENSKNESFEVNYRLWKALMHADGTHPLDLPDKGCRILPKLKEYELVHTSRFVRDDGILNRFILFPFSDKMQTRTSAFKAINTALPVVSVLILAVGIYLMASTGAICGSSFNLCLYSGLLAVSIAFHELGHLFAVLAYGYKVNDVGLSLLGIIPIGAYVAYEEKEDETNVEKIQTALAGVEMNLFIAGGCLILSTQFSQWSLTMFIAAVINVFLIGVNLLPVSGLDGESALSAVLGINNISETAKRWVTNKRLRQKLLRSGIEGYVCLCIFSIVLILNLLFRLYIGFNILCIVAVIFLVVI